MRGFVAEKTRPLDDWVLCAPIPPSNEAKHGLIMPKDFDKDVVTEGVAEVIALGPGLYNEDLGRRVPLDLEKGDRILHRGFFRYAHQVGEMFGGGKATSYFLIKVDDILATVGGKGTLGEYGEYQF